MNNPTRRRPWVMRIASSPKALVTLGVVALFGIITVALLFNGAIGWNDQGRMKTGIWLTGRSYFVSKPGYYWKLFANQEEEWPKVATISMGSYEGGKDDIDDADLDRVPVSFRGSAKAEQSVLARFQLPQSKEEMFKIWNDFPGGYGNLMRKGLVPEVQTAIRTGANLLEPEEALNNISQYKDRVEDQLRFGIYNTYSKIEEEKNESGEIERKVVTKVVEDSGTAVRRVLAFTKYGISFISAEVSLPVFDKAVETAINERRQQQLNAETSKKRRIAAEQDLLAQKAEGEAKVVQAQFQIQQEQAQVVASARLELEKSQLDVQAAENDKRAAILRAEGEAKAKELVIKADGYMEKILKAEIEKTELLSDAIKESKVSWVPEVIIINGGDAKGISSGAANLSNMAEFLTIDAAKSLAKQIKERKQ